MSSSAKIWLKGLLAAVVSGFAASLSSGIGAMSLSPETFNLNGGLLMTIKLMAITAVFNAVLGAAMYLKQSPVPPDEQGPPALPPAVAILFALLAPLSAEASPARVVLTCSEEVEVLRADTNQIEKECKDPDIYLDAGIKFDGLILRLNRPREVLVGFSAGLGYGLRFSPTWWDYTAAFFAVDLFAGGGYGAREGGPDAVSIHGLLVMSWLNWIGVGLGIEHAFGLGDDPDSTALLGTLGVSTSF